MGIKRSVGSARSDLKNTWRYIPQAFNFLTLDLEVEVLAPRLTVAATLARAHARGAGLSRTVSNTATCPI